MIQNKVFSACLAGILTAGFASGFVCFPVFADNPVDIHIVEVVDDGSGELKPWEDITGAMPGMTYSAIPRVRNSGAIPANIRMCLSESAVNATGDSIILPANTFGITINDNWKIENDGDASDPASGNCYRYNALLNVGELTEPLFSEVTISPNLENEYQGATFSLHIDAYAESEEETPEESDTGVITNNEKLSKVTYMIPYLLGSAALVVLAIHIMKHFVKTKKK